MAHKFPEYCPDSGNLICGLFIKKLSADVHTNFSGEPFFLYNGNVIVW
jgi:hypothetical protein